MLRYPPSLGYETGTLVGLGYLAREPDCQQLGRPGVRTLRLENPEG